MTIEKARKILGETAIGMSDAKILDIISFFKQIARNELDKQERIIFKGKTVRELVINL